LLCLVRLVTVRGMVSYGLVRSGLHARPLAGVVRARTVAVRYRRTRITMQGRSLGGDRWE